jgi:hypothetical protein
MSGKEYIRLAFPVSGYFYFVALITIAMKVIDWILFA